MGIAASELGGGEQRGDKASPSQAGLESTRIRFRITIGPSNACKAVANTAMP